MQAPKTTLEPMAYSISQFCVLANLGRTTVYRLEKSGELKMKKIGRKKVILKQEAERFFSSLPDSFSG